MILDTVLVSEISIMTDRNLSTIAMKKIEIDSLTFSNYVNDDLSELLTKNSNLIIKSYGKGSLSTVSFRGTGASHTQVQWNGLNINSPLTGQVDFSVIPVAFIDEVSIKPGNSSMEDQSGGLGGGIIINNRVKWDSLTHFKLSKELSDYSGKSTYFQFKSGTNKIQYKTRIGYESAKNDFTYLSATLPRVETTQQNAETQIAGIVQEIYLRPDTKNHISLLAWYSLANRNLAPLMSYEGNGHNESSKDKMLNACVEWKRYGDNHRWHFQSGIMHRENEYELFRVLSGGSVFSNYNAANRSFTINNQIKYKWKPDQKSVIATGVNIDYHQAEIIDKKNTVILTPDRSEMKFNLLATRELSQQWAVFALFRSEWMDNYFVPLIPSAGVEYKPSSIKNLSFQMNAARNFHHPTLFDLHYQPGGNINLKPETGITTESNVLYSFMLKGLKVAFNLGVYNSLIDDWILWTDTDYGYWTPVNIQKVNARGLEISKEMQLKLSSLSLALNTQYSYSRTSSESTSAEFINIKGQQLIYIPKHSLRVAFDLKGNGWFVHLSDSYTGERPVVLSLEENYKTPLHAYNLVDLHVGRSITGNVRLNFTLKIHNLLDIDYQTIYMMAMPGRYYSLLISTEI
jgi:outer membrane cobalamin receptor